MDEISEIREELASVSLIAHALSTEKERKRVRARNIIIIILSVLFVASNIAWAWYASRFERVEESEETIIEGIDQYADGGGNNTIVGGDFVNGNASKN